MGTKSCKYAYPKAATPNAKAHASNKAANGHFIALMAWSPLTANRNISRRNSISDRIGSSPVKRLSLYSYRNIVNDALSNEIDRLSHGSQPSDSLEMRCASIMDQQAKKANRLSKVMRRKEPKVTKDAPLSRRNLSFVVRDATLVQNSGCRGDRLYEALSPTA